VIWDGVFPDRRDAHVLSAMPLRNRLLVVSRMAALGLVLASIAFGVALPIGLLYGSVVADYQAGFIRAFAAHVISSGFASAFVFCTLLAVQSILVTIARGRWVHRLIVWGQFAAVILLLQMVIFRGTMVQNLRRMLAAGLEQPGGAMLWSPPLWFLGLSEVISGASQEVFRMLAWRGLVATVVSAAAAVLLYAIGYRRLVHRALETQDVPLAVAPGPLRKLIVGRLVRPLSAARPVAGAVLGFALTSFARSRRHRLLYGIYIGVGCAIVVAGLLRAAALGPRGAGFLSPPILSIGLVITFLGAVGARVLFAIPIDPSANWVFRMTERSSMRSHVAGARLALLLIAAVPPIALLLPAYAVFRGPAVAAAHAAYVLTLAWLLVEMLMWRFGRVPFTAPYVPGAANVRLLWPLYLMLFTTYAYTMAELEAWLLARPARFTIAVAAMAGAAVAVSRVSGRLSDSKPLAFEAEPGEEVTTLALSSP
jgi:hypothetical protein